jgi:hypothetical protein
MLSLLLKNLVVTRKVSFARAEMKNKAGVDEGKFGSDLAIDESDTII